MIALCSAGAQTTSAIGTIPPSELLREQTWAAARANGAARTRSRHHMLEHICWNLLKAVEKLKVVKTE